MTADNVGLLVEDINSDDGVDHLRSALTVCQLAAEALQASITARRLPDDDLDDLCVRLETLSGQLEHARDVAYRITP